MMSEECALILIGILGFLILLIGASWFYLRMKDTDIFKLIMGNLNQPPKSKGYDETREATDKELSRSGRK